MVQAAMRRYNGITNKEDRGMGMTKEEILVHVDHTLLKAVSAWDEIQTLCEEAIENHTASVCIPPSYVKRVSKAYGDKLNAVSYTHLDVYKRQVQRNQLLQSKSREAGKTLPRRPALNHPSWKSELPIRQMKKRPPIRVF